MAEITHDKLQDWFRRAANEDGVKSACIAEGGTPENDQEILTAASDLCDARLGPGAGKRTR
jgi:hypothetical protein